MVAASTDRDDVGEPGHLHGVVVGVLVPLPSWPSTLRPRPHRPVALEHRAVVGARRDGHHTREAVGLSGRAGVRGRAVAHLAVEVPAPASHGAVALAAQRVAQATRDRGGAGQPADLDWGRVVAGVVVAEHSEQSITQWMPPCLNELARWTTTVTRGRRRMQDVSASMPVAQEDLGSAANVNIDVLVCFKASATMCAHAGRNCVGLACCQARAWVVGVRGNLHRRVHARHQPEEAGLEQPPGEQPWPCAVCRDRERKPSWSSSTRGPGDSSASHGRIAAGVHRACPATARRDQDSAVCGRVTGTSCRARDGVSCCCRCW